MLQTPQQQAQVIRRAIDVLNEGGWRKNGFTDASFGHYPSLKNRHCMAGALLSALGLSDETLDNDTVMMEAAEYPVFDEYLTELQWPILQVIADQFGDGTVGDELHLISFNDHPATTFDDVIMVLEKAAVGLEASV